MVSLRRGILLSTTVAVSLLVTSCETKVAQCNKLIKVANQATTELQGMSKSNSSNATAQLKTVANSLDQYSKDMGAVEVKDEKLKGFQARFVTMYSETRDVSRSLAAALDKKDLKTAKQSLTKMQSATSQETALVNEVNQYCQDK